jgi:hypothetical protein
MTVPSVEVRIEELVLHGFAAADGCALGDAVQRELQRLITERGVGTALARRADVAWLDAGTFAVRGGTSADTTGAAVGRCVYQGLAR